MMVSYKKLWHLLIDRDMKKSHLRAAANLSPATISKLNRGDNLNTDILVRICKVLSCDVSDIMEILPDESDSDTSNER
jgi:DNA-binding Xre family transcriptional regulator